VRRLHDGCAMSDGFSFDMRFVSRPLLRVLSAAVLTACFALLPTPVRAQGCTQCLDNTAATSPATQRAYRHAILLMSTAAGAFFFATLIVLRRHR
jgi:hypothetical protein